MIRKFKRLIRKTPTKIIPMVIGVVLLSAAINIYVYKYEIDKLGGFKTVNEEQYEEEAWTQISSLIEISSIASRQNSKYISKKIEVDLLRNYDNELDALHDEFVFESFSQQFHKILKNNLVTENGAPSSLYPPSFYTLVGLEKGVISIFSNEAVTSLTVPNSEAVISWDDYIKDRPNPKLAKKAIEATLNRDSGIIFWQTEKFDKAIVADTTEMTMSTLKEVYQKKGIDGLAHFSIISPSFITDTGDIFNVEDSTYLKKNPNYKMVILQSFNIKEILQYYQDDIAVLDKNNTENVTFLDDYMGYKFVKTIFWSLTLFIIGIFLVNIYNYDRREFEKNDESMT